MTTLTTDRDKKLLKIGSKIWLCKDKSLIIGTGFLFRWVTRFCSLKMVRARHVYSHETILSSVEVSLSGSIKKLQWSSSFKLRHHLLCAAFQATKSSSQEEANREIRPSTPHSDSNYLARYQRQLHGKDCLLWMYRDEIMHRALSVAKFTSFAGQRVILELHSIRLRFLTCMLNWQLKIKSSGIGG